VKEVRQPWGSRGGDGWSWKLGEGGDGSICASKTWEERFVHLQKDYLQ
jgi:hypothetical protein